jgi:hypothetical protein
MKSATGTYHSPNDKDLYGTLQNVKYHRSLDTQIANNALSADVRCKEVCVYCFEVFTLASQYIAHADTHRDADMTKNSYTRQICDRLRQNVAESLDNCQLKGIQTKKRTRELAGTPGARRVKAKLDVVDAITNLLLLYFPSFIGINSLCQLGAYTINASFDFCHILSHSLIFYYITNALPMHSTVFYNILLIIKRMTTTVVAYSKLSINM